MQLLFEKSEEGNLSGLGLIKGNVKRFDGKYSELKVPHMGWNTIDVKINSPLLESLENSRFYFVHSFYANCSNANDILATTDYGQNFASIVCNNNVYGAQFHPEKSHRFGMRMFQNFLNF
jgi:glutamine amidotransferase